MYEGIVDPIYLEEIRTASRMADETVMLRQSATALPDQSTVAPFSLYGCTQLLTHKIETDVAVDET